MALKLIPDSGYHAEQYSFVAAMTYNLGAAVEAWSVSIPSS